MSHLPLIMSQFISCIKSEPLQCRNMALKLQWCKKSDVKKQSSPHHGWANHAEELDQQHRTGKGSWNMPGPEQVQDGRHKEQQEYGGKIPNNDEQAAWEITELWEEPQHNRGRNWNQKFRPWRGGGGCALSEEREFKTCRKWVQSSGIVLCSPLTPFPLSPGRCLRQRLGLVNLQRLHAVSPQHNHDLPHSPLQFMTTMTSRTSSL